MEERGSNDTSGISFDVWDGRAIKKLLSYSHTLRMLFWLYIRFLVQHDATHDEKNSCNLYQFWDLMEDDNSNDGGRCWE